MSSPARTLRSQIPLPFKCHALSDNVFAPNAAARRHHRRGNRHRFGHGLETKRGRFRAGRTAFRPCHCSMSAASGQKRGGSGFAGDPAAHPADARQIARLDRAAAMLLLAAQEAWQQAGWKPAENLPLVLGTTAGGMSLGEAYFRQAMQKPRGIASKPPGPFIISRKSRREWFSTPLVSAGRSPSSRMPAPPAAMPSATPGN